MKASSVARSAGEFTYEGLIRQGDLVVCGQACAEPTTLTQKLIEESSRLGELRVFLGTVFSQTFSQTLVPTLQFSSYGAIGATAELAKLGRLDIVPTRYSQLGELFSAGARKPDVVLLQSSAQRCQGSVSCGLAHDYTLEAARHARLVIAELNEQVPWTHGSRWPDDLRVDHWVRADRGPVELMSSAPDEKTTAIARHVASLIPDEATIQIGVGSVPDATLGELRHHRCLGIHSGVFTDAMAGLMREGVITNTHKGTDAGVSVTNTVCGSAKLYQWVDRNPAVHVRAASYTHSEAVLARLHRFRAINAALEVDLQGQANCEAVDGKLRGGIGGLVDFCRGALRGSQGRSITVLPATASGGTRSKIVPTLRGNPVTLSKCDIDLVVTEYGVADLRYASLNERAKRLIAIAAPQFREELAWSFRKSGRRET